jgi:hypothetical protein
MRTVNEVIRKFLSVVEVPIFGAAVLAILVIGENNFFSTQMSYGTEPIASIGTSFRPTPAVQTLAHHLTYLTTGLRAMGADSRHSSGYYRLSLPPMGHKSSCCGTEPGNGNRLPRLRLSGGGAVLHDWAADGCPLYVPICP